jgi:hypothetical protein
MEISSEFGIASQWLSVAGIPEPIAGPTSSGCLLQATHQKQQARKKKEAAAGLCRPSCLLHTNPPCPAMVPYSTCFLLLMVLPALLLGLAGAQPSIYFLLFLPPQVIIFSK